MAAMNLKWCETMPSLLEFKRYSQDLDRQLLRRIGYTNGLHHIERFARVVEYVYPIIPCSELLLREIIMHREKTATEEQAIKGTKYAQGVVDVARALGLLEKVGPKLSLTGQGYALHAIKCSLNSHEDGVKLFLFVCILNSDGEYTLNILRLIDEGWHDTQTLGEELLRKRIFSLMRFKEEWAQQLPDKASRDVTLGLLTKAKRILEKALSKGRVDLFFKHTINPRRGWLRDLGYIEQTSNSSAELTPTGHRVLDYMDRRGCNRPDFTFLPLSEWLASTLGLPNFVSAEDFFWGTAAFGISGLKATSDLADDTRVLLGKIKEIYPYVKLVGFNEAEVSSLYEVLACSEATKGMILPRSDFDKALQKAFEVYPDEIFRLSKRRGVGSYIALKRARYGQ
jgi:hypothetical protein